MIYDYKDTFVTNSIDDEVLRDQEMRAISEVDLIGVTKEPFREKLVTYSVYMELALMQMEADGMQEKYTGYRKEYDRYYNMTKVGSPSNISNISLGRG